MKASEIHIAAAEYVSSLLSGVIEGVGMAVGSFAKSSMADFMEIETSEDQMTLVTASGSLVSGIRVRGAFTALGGSEFEAAVAAINRALTGFLSTEGHSIDFVAMRDYSNVTEAMHELIEGSVNTCTRLDLDFKDVLEAKADRLAQFCATEDILIALWTTPQVLLPSDQKLAQAERVKVASKLPQQGPCAQRFALSSRALRERHEAFVSSVFADLGRTSLQCVQMTAHEMCHAARMAIDPEFTGPNQMPLLPGDKLPAVLRGYAKNKQLDFGDVQYPPLSWYLAPRDAERLDSRFVRVGGRVYAPVYVDIPPSELQPFRALIAKLHSSALPWRCSFKISGGGMTWAASMKKTLASLMSFASNSNNLLYEGATYMEQVRKANLTSVRLQISFVTWADNGDVDLARTRASRLAKMLSSWGKVEARDITGHPIDGLMSTVPFVGMNSVGSTSIAPLSDVIRITPLFRPASPWTSGSLLYRTNDGKIFPFDPNPESGVQTAGNYYWIAPPGFGKSVSMGSFIVGACTSPGISRLPRVAILDIGPTSETYIEMLKEAVNPKFSHQVGYFRLQMTREHAINIFDTALGCRFPFPDQQTFISNFLTEIATPPEMDTPYDSMGALCNRIVTALYERYSDGPRGTPKRYAPGVEPIVDELISQYNFEITRDTSWWSLVDFLAARNQIHAAHLAQRNAVPVLPDAPGPASEPQIRDQYDKVKLKTGESLSEAFKRLIQEACQIYPNLSNTTRFDLGDVRIGAMNIEDVAKKGNKAANKQTSLMYMLAKFALAKDFRSHPENLKHVPEAFKAYHAVRMQEINEDLKIMLNDEFHRASSSPAVIDDVEVDLREGRKWRLINMIASQSIEDFPARYKEFYSGVFILNSGTSTNAEELRKLFGFSETARDLLVDYCNGPTHKGAPFLGVFKTKKGEFAQLLYLTLSSIETWAMSTSPSEAAVRRRLYARLDKPRARQLLASIYPNGIDKEIERRKLDYGSDQGDIIGAIAEDLLAVARNIELKMPQSAH